MLSMMAVHAALVIPSSPTRYPLNVYIEDTDTYGVVFYANYLKFFERAAVDALGPAAIGSSLAPPSNLLFGLQSADGLRYSVPATLGDACEVSLEPLGFDNNGRFAMKAALLRQSDGKELFTAADLRFGFVDARGQSAPWPLVDADVTPTAPDDPCDKPLGAAPEASASPALVPPNLVLNLDEASAAGGVDLHAALRYFERHRTTYLGGPAALGALSETGVNVVVGRLNKLRLLPAAHAVNIGCPLEVRCQAKLKARGSQVIFEQWVVDAESAEPLARGEVTCLMIQAETGRIVPAPEEIMKQLEPYI